MAEEEIKTEGIEGEVEEKAEFTEEDYIEMRVKHDKNPDFKALRHRFWQLGLKRRYNVLVHLGIAYPGEILIEKVERFRLYRLREEARENELVAAIEVQEAEIVAESKDADYLSGREPGYRPSGRAHAGRVPASRLVDRDIQGEPKSPWGD